MAITQKLLNMDSYFHSTTGPKIIVNDLNYFSVGDQERVSNTLMTVYDKSDVIPVKPCCDCGNLQGAFLLGKLCPDCGTTCKTPDEKVEPILWLRALKLSDGREMRFLNPTFWLTLSKILDPKTDWLRWLTDSKYNPRINIPAHIAALKNELGGIRSYDHVMNNLHKILTFISTLPKYKDHYKKEQLNMLIRIYNEEGERLFSRYIPIINKKLLIIENTTKGRFVNLVAADVIDTVMSWLKVSSGEKVTDKAINNCTGSLVSSLATVYNKYFEDYLVRKEGIFRKHVYGARSHFTFRFVIVSVPGPHKKDEIHVPWVAGPTAFRPHLLNKLTRRGYTYKEANKILYRSVKKYDPLIAELLQELIDESPYRGIPAIINRNPSLKQGSTQLVYITKFKDKPDEFTLDLSQLVVKLGNGLSIIMLYIINLARLYRNI